MFDIESMQKAIREEHLDGWLFCNFNHRDTLTDALLRLDPQTVSSRRWFYIIRTDTIPVKIVHAIEKNILDSLPGETIVYSTREMLETNLQHFASFRMAILCDPFIQVLSTLDAASYQLLATCGMTTVTAAPLVQRIKGLLDQNGIESHEKAAAILYSVVHGSWKLVTDAFAEGKAISEGEIQDYMLQRFDDSGLITDHPPIVACGSNAGNPHYSVPFSPETKQRGSILQKNDVVQFDLWAKFPSGIYADISWIGFCGTQIPSEIQHRFDTIIAARDLVKPAIEKAFAEHTGITGSQIDTAVRTFLLKRVPPEAVQHRTGHGIDTDCHGSGTNLDSVEFPDNRLLLEGSCFSVEPGIYFADSGFRTEINIYIHQGKPVISGEEIQKSLLSFQD